MGAARFPFRQIHLHRISLLTDDVLFLIRGPWISQVWHPLVVSGLTVLAVLLAPRLRSDAPPTAS